MRALAAAVAALAATPAAAQVEDRQVWVNATVTGPVAGRLIYFAEVQPRIGDDVSRLTQLLLRPAIGWQATPTLALYQGYAHVVDPVERGADLREDRSFQQATWTVATGRLGQLQSRTRLEQRWRRGAAGTGHRLRQMARWELPLQRRERAVAALAHVEGFVGLNETRWGQPAGVDQVRLFAGAELPLAKKSTLEAGYLAQALDRTVNRVNHVLSLSLFLRH